MLASCAKSDTAHRARFANVARRARKSGTELMAVVDRILPETPPGPSRKKLEQIRSATKELLALLPDSNRSGGLGETPGDVYIGYGVAFGQQAKRCNNLTTNKSSSRR